MVNVQIQLIRQLARKENHKEAKRFFNDYKFALTKALDILNPKYQHLTLRNGNEDNLSNVNEALGKFEKYKEYIVSNKPFPDDRDLQRYYRTKLPQFDGMLEILEIVSSTVVLPKYIVDDL